MGKGKKGKIRERGGKGGKRGWRGKERVKGKKGRGKKEEDGKEQEREGQGKSRDEKGRREGTEGEEKGSPEKLPKPRFFNQIFTSGAAVPSLPPQSGPNLARKCGPTVYSSMPKFILSDIYCYI